MTTCAIVIPLLRRILLRATPCFFPAQLRASLEASFASSKLAPFWLEREKKEKEEMSTDEEPAFARPRFRGKGADDSWKKIQERTFTNWVNDRLRGNLKVAKQQVRDPEVARAITRWREIARETMKNRQRATHLHVIKLKARNEKIALSK